MQAPARKLHTPLTHVSPQLIASAETLAILRVSRNSLSSFVRQGLLQRFRLRVRVTEGPRLRFYYLREIKKSEKKDLHITQILSNCLCDCMACLCKSAFSLFNVL